MKTYYPPTQTIGVWDIVPGRPGEYTCCFHRQTGAVKRFHDYGTACDWAQDWMKRQSAGAEADLDAERQAHIQDVRSAGWHI